jgi:hypothetical protein
MTYVESDFMRLDTVLFRRSLAEALAYFLNQKYTTSKQIARAIDIDPATADNLRKGHLSVTTLEKALRAEGRDLWSRLGEEMFGETDLEYHERVIEEQIAQAEHARQNIVRLRERREEALKQAVASGLVQSRPQDVSVRRVVGQDRPILDGFSEHAAEVADQVGCSL